MATTDRFASPIISALKAGEPDAVARAIRFLDKRLTDAAKAGCHHCDEASAAHRAGGAV